MHLRPDGDDIAGLPILHRRQRRALSRGRRLERGVAELGRRRARPPLHGRARRVAAPVLAPERGRRPRRYVEFVREETDLKLGIEADYIRGREDRMGKLLDDARVGLRRRLGALPRRPRRRLRRRDRHLALRDDAGAGVDAVLRGARGVGDAAGSSTSSPTPIWSRSGARAARAGEGPALLLRAGGRGDARGRRGDGGLHRRAAQAGRRDLPVAAVPGDGGRRGHPDRAVLGRAHRRPARVRLRGGGRSCSRRSA